jgi:hypothetical protein
METVHTTALEGQPDMMCHYSECRCRGRKVGMGKARLDIMLRQAAHRHSMAAFPNIEKRGSELCELRYRVLEAHARFQESFGVMICP